MASSFPSPVESFTHEQLVALVTAHREEFIDTFHEFVLPDAEPAYQALADFEKEALARV